jgi:hypothetical protein
MDRAVLISLQTSRGSSRYLALPGDITTECCSRALLCNTLSHTGFDLLCKSKTGSVAQVVRAHA